MSLLCCYLTVGVIFAFASLVEVKSANTFDGYFHSAQYILSGRNGLVFSQGKLVRQDSIPKKTLIAFRKYFPSVKVKNIYTANNQEKTAYLVVEDKLPKSQVMQFSKTSSLRLLSSYTQPKNNEQAFLYNLNDHQNRFSFFSFENQLSASVLGSQLATEIGRLSKLIFAAAAMLTFYITLLYFRERKTESAILIIQGFIDLNFKITLFDCLIQNLIAFLGTIAAIPFILRFYTVSSTEFDAGINGLIYIVPYLPVIMIIQVLVLLNQSLSYAAKFK